ncbi:hypothetical protein ANAPC1_00206 [Anaplasma phagocytophilum]|uniref:Uncharacterized protein n=1 Tax=Anaplasma phagocytophilum TaxID=948 RepID=A0AA45US32_ANAPH|nr:hypothetical protein ANAPC1_00206 [Anaplasma phagocytophilum]
MLVIQPGAILIIRCAYFTDNFWGRVELFSGMLG